MARRYSKKAQENVREAVKKYKKGTLKSGATKKTVKNRRQAIAIGLSEARKKGAKMPAPSKRGRGAKKISPKKFTRARAGTTKKAGTTSFKKSATRKRPTAKNPAKRKR